jgi:hypothetical protein
MQQEINLYHWNTTSLKRYFHFLLTIILNFKHDSGQVLNISSQLQYFKQPFQLTLLISLKV